MTDDPPLASNFPAASHETWRELAQAALKDRPFERLVSRTDDGIAIAPLYERAADATPLAMRHGPWQVMQRVDLPDAVAASAEALHELENGASALALVFHGAPGDQGFGLDGSETAIRRVLDGIHLDAGISIDLDAGPQGGSVARTVAAVVRESVAPAAAADIRFGLDPLGVAAMGGASQPWSDAARGLAHLVAELSSQGFRGPFVAADGRIVHAAGGSQAQELGYVLASAVAYWRALEAGGLAVDAAREMIFFRLAADADEFLTIAKFRALRKLWARVETASGLAPRRIFISGETAWRMMARRDPWVNMLRTGVAAFAAGVGGADAVTVLPFTAALGLPDRFARRVARNAQLLLLEESHLAKVADPAAGSGVIEALTDELCRVAWALFQEIERAGGTAAALERGLIQAKIATTRTAHLNAVAVLKEPLTGTSTFPDLKERPVAVLDAAPRHAARPEAALPCIRLAEPFEDLRDTSDRILAATGRRPAVFLATLGTPAQFTVRAGFAKSFFESGGIEAVGGDGFANHDAMLAAFKAAATPLACLCSSDAVYAGEAAPAARMLVAAGARPLYLAGRPQENEAVAAAGIDGFIFAGCDAPAMLRSIYSCIANGRETPHSTA